ncbi:hypothetical protein PIB30_033688 [Stylosanthes scabra]|uniref:Uncharacterized protein n=1 Tax=Stylosanthes scabra TaxID=79078 RepID=A0ABU6WB04_9FABA|nr:hypothetical protein [Stylosanthes scabra]
MVRPQASRARAVRHSAEATKLHGAMDRKRKALVAKGKGKLTMPPTRKSLRLTGLPPFLPPTSPKSVLRPNKLLVLAIAADAVEIHPKPRGNTQAVTPQFSTPCTAPTIEMPHFLT